MLCLALLRNGLVVRIVDNAEGATCNHVVVNGTMRSLGGHLIIKVYVVGGRLHCVDDVFPLDARVYALVVY